MLNLQNRLEIGIFQTTIENMLLYSANSWTLTKMRKRLNGTYMRMLTAILGENNTNKELYEKLQSVAELQEISLRSSGHIWKREDELLSKSKHGKRETY